LIISASGLALGIVFSAVLFKRTYLLNIGINIYINLFFFKLGRPWPVFFGTGIGLGMGYSNCQNDFRSPYVHPRPVSLTKTDGALVTVKKKIKLIRSNNNYFYRSHPIVDDLFIGSQYKHKYLFVSIISFIPIYLLETLTFFF